MASIGSTIMLMTDHVLRVKSELPLHFLRSAEIREFSGKYDGPVEIKERLGMFSGMRDIMRNHDDSEISFPTKRIKRRIETPARIGIECRRGLVQNKQIRISDRRPREKHPLLLTAGELPYRLPLEIEDIEFPQSLNDTIAVVSGKTSRIPLPGKKPETDYFTDRRRKYRIEGVYSLRKISDPSKVSKCPERNTEEVDFAVMPAVGKPQHEPHKGRFSSTVRSRDREIFSGTDGKRNVGQNFRSRSEAE